MVKELVSILMVNYNHADVIEDAIKSVLGQSYENFQFIIVDDGSTDASCDIIKQYDDPRIEFYSQPINRHICAVTNFGMEKVRGEYLARIDSDDIWYPEKLEKQMKFLNDHPEYDICFSYVDIIDEKGNKIIDSDIEKLYQVHYQTQSEWLEHFFMEGNCLALPSVLMRRKIMDDTGIFKMGYMQSHDFDYWVRIAKRCTLHVLQESLIGVRRYENNMNNSNLSEVNTTRFYNEYLDIKKHFFDDMSKEVFIETFQKHFRNPDSYTEEELECEKAFLLCLPHGLSESIPPAGIEKFLELLQKPEYVKLLEEKYDFTVKDFYEMTGKHIYNDYFLECRVRQLNEEREKRQRLEQEKRRKEQELEELIAAYENSTSWKLTRPFRKIMKVLKR